MDGAAGGYTARDAASILGIPVARVLGYARAGLLSPARGEDGESIFTMRDLVVLRTAKGLSERVPPRKVTRALTRLLARLPEGRPLTSVRIEAEGAEVVVRDEAALWLAESGQGLLDFGAPQQRSEVTPLARRSAVPVPSPDPGTATATADDWYALGGELEAVDAGRAREAYGKAVELDPAHAAARLDLGRLLHEAGRPAEAAEQYRLALDASLDGATATTGTTATTAVTATFNLGVALQDLGREGDAIVAYERAVELDPEHADAHFNLSRLLEKAGRRAAAFRHLKAYRQLTLGR